MNIDINMLSDEYKVHKLTEDDIEDIFNLCIKNSLYYKHCPPLVTREIICDDMVALPPKVNISDKYYVGFYCGEELIAIMDLIDGYPEKSVAFIGFFITDVSIQKNGIGTKIIKNVCNYLKTLKFQSIQLAWVKGNPQSENFWIKNGFVKIKETSSTASKPRYYEEFYSIIPFPKQFDVKELLKNIDDTTKTMFAKNRYKEYTIEELIQIQEGNKKI